MTGSGQPGPAAAWTRPVSIVIPTYRRERVLVETLERVLALDPAAAEVLVVDQSENHEPETEDRLSAWEEDSRLRWLRLPRPSIPGAMNRGLLEARCPIVLYLDDDVVPGQDLVEEHWQSHAGPGVDLVAGHVTQPWDPANGSAAERRAGGTGGEERWVEEFMGGNFSVKRSVALSLGGFDENFVGAAYRFESEFADRLLSSGGRIRSVPAARLAHLKARQGGTRAFGDYRRTLSPAHAVGEYYYLFRSSRVRRRAARVLARIRGAVVTRHHLRRPWWIPATLVAEGLGVLWGAWLAVRRPGTIGPGARGATDGD